jgi:hypothetical protein
MNSLQILALSLFFLLAILCLILWALSSPPMPKITRRGRVTRYIPSRECASEIDDENP